MIATDLAAEDENCEGGSTRQMRSKYPALWEKLFAASASLLILAVYGWATDRDRSDWEFGNEVFLRLAIFIAIISGGFISAKYIWCTSNAVSATWWNIGGKLDNPSWEDVRRMTIGKPADDPIAYDSQNRSLTTAAKSIASYVILGCLLIEAVTFVASGPIIPRLHPDQSTDTDGLSANLTALLALFAAGVSIYFTYRQLQAKVRADSRQAWIDKLRTHIAAFIALVDPLHEGEKGGADGSWRVEFAKRRIEMELMLNPSEKDHRLLMYLSLRLAFFRSGEKLFSQVHDVRNVRETIQKDPDYEKSDWVEMLGPIPATSSQNYRLLQHDLIGYTLRLAHVVLKREWQRVKATQ